MGAIHRFQMPVRVFGKKFLKILAAVSAAKHSREAPGGTPVRVLMYHRINNYRKNELSIATDRFEKQVAWLHAQGFANLRMADLEQGRHRIIGSPHVVFTFDDGYEDNFLNAMPILKKFGYTGIFYLATEYPGSGRMFPRDVRESNRPLHNRMLNWQQVADMVAGGMEIGSHTRTHADLRRMSPEEARLEIEGSKQELEKRLGIETTSFCYPAGRYTDATIKLVRNSGYRSACTTDIGVWNGHSLFSIPRIPVLASDAFFVFKRKISGELGWLRHIH